MVKTNKISHYTTIASERIYLDELEDKGLPAFFRDRAFLSCSAKHSAYNMLFSKKHDYDEYLRHNAPSLSDYLNLQALYPQLNAYELNSALNLGKGMYKSQESLRKQNVNVLEDKIKHKEKQLSDTTKKLGKYIRTRDGFLAWRDEGRPYKGSLANVTVRNGCAYVRDRDKYREYGPYEFEYQFLNARIRQLRHNISQLAQRLNRMRQKLDKLKDRPRRMDIKKRDTKYRRYEASGRSDAKCKNFIFKCAHVEDDKFMITIATYDEPRPVIARFPYGWEALEHALRRGVKAPIGFCLRMRTAADGREYLQFQASFDKALPAVNACSKACGVVAIDLNAGHVDAAETDARGNLVNAMTRYYMIDGTSSENAASMARTVKEIIEYAASKGKEAVIEDLDMRDSKKNAWDRNKKLNKILGSFPYARFERSVSYWCIECNTSYTNVNPAYTSVIGTLKYASRRCVPSHQAAAYVIGRRGMGFHERVPREYLPYLPGMEASEWSKWACLNKININKIDDLYKNEELPRWKLARKHKSMCLL